MSNNQTAYFYQLLRLSLGLAQEFPNDLDTEMWRWLYPDKTMIFITHRTTVCELCDDTISLIPTK